MRCVESKHLLTGRVSKQNTRKHTMKTDPKPDLKAEFADHQNVKRLFGFSRSYAYWLASQGKIKSVSIRKPGAKKGRRLFDCASIRNFLATLTE